MPELIKKPATASLFSVMEPEKESAFQQEVYEKKHPSPLKRKFGVAPFSVLHPDAGEWKARKSEWIHDIGLKGEQGRSDSETIDKAIEPGGGGGPNSVWLGRKAPDAVPGGGGPRSARRMAAKDTGKCFGSGEPGDLSAEFRDKENVAGKKGFAYAASHNAGLDEKTQRALSVYAAHGGSVVSRGTPMEAGLCHGEVPSYDGGNRSVAGTSIFDPVLTELLYLWYGKKDGTVLDPFAGGGTRGIVAAYHGLKYTGIEIRPGQVAANEENALECQANVRRLLSREIELPTWIVGDSSTLEEVLAAHEDPFSERTLFDFLIACPPYYDLEVYSCGKEDGSYKQTYEEFVVWYKAIFKQAVDRLAWNRFAGIVIGDIREHDDLGTYLGRPLPEDTIRIFSELGLFPYAKFVLETAKGSLPVRVGGQFPAYRKPGATHQYVYLFWKGDRDKKAIPAALGKLGEEEFSIGEGEVANVIDS